MTPTKFIIKTASKIIIFAFLMIVAAAIMSSLSPVVSNEIALGQMQNSDEAFILMNTYNKVRPVISAVFTGITIWFTCTIVRDTYKFFKNQKEN